MTTACDDGRRVMHEVLENHPEICDFSVVMISVDLLMVTGKYQECLTCMGKLSLMQTL